MNSYEDVNDVHIFGHSCLDTVLIGIEHGRGYTVARVH